MTAGASLRSESRHPRVLSRDACLSFAVGLGVKMSDSSTVALKRALSDKLGAERGGRRLGSGLRLVEVIIDYLVVDVEVKDANELVLADLRETAREAWAEKKDGAALPPGRRWPASRTIALAKPSAVTVVLLYSS